MKTSQSAFARWIAPAAVAALFVSAMWSSQAGGSKLTARSTFQAVVYQTNAVPEPGPAGTVTLTKSGDKQSLSVKITDLGGTSYMLFHSDSMSTNPLLYYIATLDRGASNDTWQLKLSSNTGIPPQLGYFFSDIEDLAGQVLYAGYPSGETNEFGEHIIKVPLAAPILPLTAAPANVNAKAPLYLPAAPPSPRSIGWIKTKFQESSGRSLMDISAKNLPGGQGWRLFVTDAPGSSNFVDVGNITADGFGPSVRFIRDTKKGDRLPLDVRCVTNLSGCAVEIVDDGGVPHLIGVMP